MHQPTSSARPSLQDTTRKLNIMLPPPSEWGKSSKKLMSQAMTKAIYHHIEVAKKQAEVFVSSQCKHTARKSAVKASLKTASWVYYIILLVHNLILSSDFCANSILDLEINSQQWYNNLIQDGESQGDLPIPAIEVEEEEPIEAEETYDACANCAHLLAQLEHSHMAHRKTCNNSIKLARDYNSLVREAKFLRESMVFAGAKITEMAGGMSGTIRKLLDPDSE